jgi:hypothetical protein
MTDYATRDDERESETVQKVTISLMRLLKRPAKPL